jgi:hypothetical protein
LRRAIDYLTLRQSGHLPLVVSPTHAEAAKVTDAIREAKREAGQLGADRKFIRYHNLQWEEAERGLPENYHAGLVVQFHQNVKGIQRGELCRITGRDESGRVQYENAAGKKSFLPLKEAVHFQVFEQREINLARGDQIRMTHGGETADGRRINNGDLFRIEQITKKGQLVLNTGAKLNPDHGHLTLGYVQTSHSSQSRSVRDVLIAQSEDSFVASSLNQFYVSASRAKQSIRIYTDDRRGLQAAVGNSSARMASVELAQLSKAELNSFMSTEMGAKQWLETIQARRVGTGESFGENIVKGGRQSSVTTTGAKNWEAYVASRRAVTHPGGRSRTKGGHPGHPGNVQKVPKAPRPDWPSITSQTKGAAKVAEKKPEQKPAPKPARPSRMDRLRSNLQASKEHFGKVMARSKQEPKPQSRPIKVGNAKIPDWQAHTKANEKRVVQKAAKSQQLQAGKQIQKTVKPPTIPPPRRGK